MMSKATSSYSTVSGRPRSETIWHLAPRIDPLPECEEVVAAPDC